MLEDWNNTVWNVLVEKGIVHNDKSITYIFKNGREIKVEAE